MFLLLTMVGIVIAYIFYCFSAIEQNHNPEKLGIRSYISMGIWLANEDMCFWCRTLNAVNIFCWWFTWERVLLNWNVPLQMLLRFVFLLLYMLAVCTFNLDLIFWWTILLGGVVKLFWEALQALNRLSVMHE